jgi:hypothetical protein
LGLNKLEQWLKKGICKDKIGVNFFVVLLLLFVGKADRLDRFLPNVRGVTSKKY